MARSYKRDASGRFSSTGGGSGKGKSKASGGSKGKAAGGVPSGGKPPPPAWSASMLRDLKKAKAAKAAKEAKAAKAAKEAKATKKDAKPAKKSAKPANKVAPSPRRLSAAEKDYAEITGPGNKSKFRSSKKVREEMQRRGFLKGADPQGELIQLADTVRRKKGQGGMYTNWMK